MKCKSYKTFFEVIANHTRVKIIESLNKSPKAVTELADNISEEQSKVSHNLKVLTKCNFVSFRRDGKKKIYSLNDSTIIPIIKMVDEHVNLHCDGAECWGKKNAQCVSG